MRKLYISLVLLTFATAAFTACCLIFDSIFAELTIDYFAFFAGAFLMAEGVFRILSEKKMNPFSPVQISRSLRVVIGTCVFTIHLLQFTRY